MPLPLHLLTSKRAASGHLTGVAHAVGRGTYKSNVSGRSGESASSRKVLCAKRCGNG